MVNESSPQHDEASGDDPALREAYAQAWADWAASDDETLWESTSDDR